MTDTQLYTKISLLPSQLKMEVLDFVDFLASKQGKGNRKEKKGRVFGYAKDTITLKPDFDEPLKDFEEYM